MNDNTEKPKPTIFYAKNSDPKKLSPADKNKRSGRDRNDNTRGRQQGNEKAHQWKNKRLTGEESDSSDRIETFKPNRPQRNKPYQDSKFDQDKKPYQDKKLASREDDAEVSDSPWKKSRKVKPIQDALDYDANRQRKEETIVYSENSCKAVFKHRKEAIIKAFITQEAAPQFKHLIEWLVSQRLGYDIVSNEQITKMTETPHHGGICLITKKRQPLSVIEYLERNQNKEQDYVLAIDDVNNPHNLGGLVRTAAFYGINGLLLRQTNLLESGAAMRVAEGGTEALIPLKTDDFVVSLDLLKQQGYQIVVLLPCQIASAKADELHKMKLAKKTVFVIFQRINPKLIDCADQVVYLKGNENMGALNISVATGILLSQI